MGFLYYHLDDPDVRREMTVLWTDENETLVGEGLRDQCYGKDLIEPGWEQWDRVMPQALAEHDDAWLLQQMFEQRFWRTHRPPTRVGYKEVRVNLQWACNLLAGEFNIAYIRGLATVLMERGETECVVYRASDASEPRCECTAWEGHRFSLQEVLDGHRVRYWPEDSADETAFSVPSGFNCHHGIHAVGI
jgi:hypothetical protein